MRPLTLLLITCAVALNACGASSSDKAGGRTPPKVTTLTFANANGDSAELQPFAGAVARLSGGTLRIRFQNSWRNGETRAEAGLIRDVAAGKADLGWAGTRAFHDVGVRAFDALHAPLLIDSYELEQAVLESPLPQRMLPSLKSLHVAGLGILPGPLRKPLGTKAFVRPGDFAGQTVALQHSQVAGQTLRALGARPADIPAGGPIDAFDGVEQQVISIAGNDYDRSAPALAANVNLWPRPLVLFADPQALDRLDERQQRALRDAARAALKPTLDVQRRGDTEGSQALCRRHVTFTVATDGQLATLRRAVRPVYDRLAEDATTRTALAEIRRSAATLDAPPATIPCTAVASSPRAATGATPVDGVYRADVTREQLKRAPGFDAGEDNPGNTGHFRLQLRDGRYRLSGSEDGVDQEGDFAVKGDILTFLNWNGEDDFSYRWSLYRGALTLKKIGGGPSPFVVHPWRREDRDATVAKPTPIDGAYELETTRDEVAKASGESPGETFSENYGHWRFTLRRGVMRYTQEAEGAHRWVVARYTVRGDRFTFTITDFGGEAPNGAAEKTGETFDYKWSLDRGRLTLKPVPGKVSPEGFSLKAWRRR